MTKTIQREMQFPQPREQVWAAIADRAALAEWMDVLKIDPENKSAKLYIRVVKDEHGPQAGSALPR